MQELAGWANFYVIVGSAAGALIGLQFVVMTLIAQLPGARDVERGSHAFATPTIVHFGSVLLLSAAICAPWRGVGGAAVLWGALGLAGVFYVAITIRRMRTQTAYSPVFEDWLFYSLLPVAAYGTLAVSACAVRFHDRVALFAVGGAALLLLFTGIHNAWDAVTYHVILVKDSEGGHQQH